MYRKILVPLDGSHFAERALPRALALASAWDAELALVVVAELLPEAPAGDYLDGVRRRIRGAGLEASLDSTVISPGNVASSLVSHLAEVGADFCVMTTHARGPVQRSWLGSTADRFIRRSPIPVLLLRSTDEDGASPPDLSETPAPFGTVLIPVDGSDASERMIDIAVPLTSGAEGARLLLVRAVPPFVPGGSPYIPHLVRESHEHEQVEAVARGYLETLAERARPGGTGMEVRVVTAGQPAVAILRVAEEEGADLIAMSTQGRGGVARLLLGSVADKVVRGASIPVLLHREQEPEG